MGKEEELEIKKLLTKEGFYNTMVNVYKETGQGPDRLMFTCFLEPEYLDTIMGIFDELIEEGLIVKAPREESGGYYYLTNSPFQTEKEPRKYLDYIRKFLNADEPDSPFYCPPSDEDYQAWIKEYDLTIEKFQSTPYYEKLGNKK